MGTPGIITASAARESATAHLVGAIMGDVASAVRRHEARSITSMFTTEFRKNVLNHDIIPKLKENGYNVNIEYNESGYMYVTLSWEP